MKKSFLTFAIIAVFSLTACQSEDNPTLTIIHSNDTHSQFEPSTGEDTHGGVIERASIIELLRQEDPSLLYLDAGDMVQGSPYFNIFNGELEVLVMNEQGLVASTLGNHEFDNGIDGLTKMYEKANFAILSCNYDCTGTALEKYIQPYKIIKQNGIKIGITGVTCNPEGLIFNRNWEGIKYKDAAEAANTTAAELRKKGCDLIILLSHVGFYSEEKKIAENDQDIASKSKDIDLIIGGHTHTNIEEGVYILNAEGKPVYITQNLGMAGPLGRVKIEMQKSSEKRRKYEVKNIVIDKLHPENYDLSSFGGKIKELLQPYQAGLTSKMGTVIGQAPETMKRDRPQSLLSNFTSDALRAYGSKIYGKEMDLSIMNFGGLRSDLDKGDVTIGTMFRIYPFENALSILEIKGEYLEKAIKAVAGKGLEGFSGSKVTLHKNGSKVEATKILIGNKCIDPDRIYYVATIDYLAEGNDGLSALSYATKTTNTGILLRDMMTEWVTELTAEGKKIESKLDDRVTTE